MENKKINIIAAIIGLFIGGIFFYFFRYSLFIWFNILCSVILAALIWGCISFIYNPLLPEERKTGIGLGILSIILILCLHSCFYVSPEENVAKIKRQELNRQINELKEQADREEKERLAKLEEEENLQFANSGKDIMIFGPAENESWALTRAKSALKRFAKNPDSIKDVIALSKPVRIRIKQYPKCRYALQVQYMGQNSFGATSRHTGVVLFDSNWYGFTVLEKSPF